MTKGANNSFDVIIIGGGFYGCYLAVFLKKFFSSISIMEKASALMTAASYVNQARVHNGYHYPRSLLTALRSHINFQKFIVDYRDCIVSDFKKIYAISKTNSKTSASQFKKVCSIIGAPLKISDAKTKSMFNMNLIEEVFDVYEVAFDAVKIEQVLQNKLRKEKVNLIFNTEVQSVKKWKRNKLCVRLENGEEYVASYVINCTYAGINALLKNSHLPLLPFKYEMTEVALVDVPREIKNMGITVVDGPFFSLMPFPSENLHSLTHVRYTPHYSWTDKDMSQSVEKKRENDLSSNFIFMQKDAERYLPILKNDRYIKSLYATKTLLLENELDDGRPILFRKDYGLKNFYVVMGGKIDNVYDISEALSKSLSKS